MSQREIQLTIENLTLRAEIMALYLMLDKIEVAEGNRDRLVDDALEFSGKIEQLKF